MDVNNLLVVIVGVILTSVLGFIVNRLLKVLDIQQTQTTDIEVIKNQCLFMSSRVDSLHEWRNRLMEEQAKRASDEINNLRAELDKLRGIQK